MKPARKPANRYHHGDLRHALLDASLEIVDQGGAGQLSLRGVARRLGVSHAAPGHHFSDRKELLAAVAARGFEALAHQMQQAAAKASSPVARLKATGVAYVEYAVAHPERFRLMFGSEILDSTATELAEANVCAFEVLVEAVRGAVGSDDPERVRVTTTAAWSLVHGLATLFIDDKLGALARRSTRSEATRLAREVTDLVAKALDVT